MLSWRFGTSFLMVASTTSWCKIESNRHSTLC